MKGSSNIYHRPYIPANRPEWRDMPCICRIAPSEHGFSMEWIPASTDAGEHFLYYSLRGEDSFTRIPLTGSTASVTDLEPETEYEFYIENSRGCKSLTRLIRTGALPAGTVAVNYLHPDDNAFEFSGKYFGSPSLARLKDGTLIAGMDVFGFHMGQNLTMLYESRDGGQSWRFLNHLYPFFWGSLFVLEDALYMIGLTSEYGNLQIARSLDGGRTWSAPVTLFYGSSTLCCNGGVHRAPMHFYKYNGRLYTSCEYGSWEMGGHLPSVISIDENADPMVPENWSCTGFLPFDGKWKEEAVTQGDTIEGNLIAGPDGRLYNCMRWKNGQYLKLEADLQDPEAPLTYAGIVSAPVARSMFRLIPFRGKYLLLTNHITELARRCANSTCRNILSFFVSEDLEHFRLVRHVINFEEMDARLYGFQYPVIIEDGDGFSMLIRSAFNNANSFHNSNYMLFCHVKYEELEAGL